MNVATGFLTGVPAEPALSPPRAASDRLNGWKSIAAHFGRDRTTVIRWARERGLPVYRVPGGRTGTVYALRHELDQWAGLGDGAVESPPIPAPSVDPTVPPSARSRHLLLFAAALFLGLVVTAYAVLHHRPVAMPTAAALPADPAIASRFLTARDLIAERRADSLERAIALLDDMTRSAPAFAPGHVALGEALLLSREFGKRSDGEAFMRARQAARAALRLDRDLVAGHRVLGFIAYWADRDFAEAAEQFHHALSIDANDAMSHFWYGNILSDHGDHSAALRSLDRARLLLPGSVAIQTDLAWARWAAGEDTAATAALHDIVRRHPDFVVAHDCLSIIALLNGDDQGYVHHFGMQARLRAHPELIERSHAIDVAMRSAGVSAMRGLLLRHAMEGLEKSGGSSLWAITIASVMRDRGQTLRLLAGAERRREQWGEAGLLRRVAAIWSNDPMVSASLMKLR